jgi:PPOX class probable F420-dependent enzyme
MSRRDQIRMSDEQVHEFLKDTKTLTICSQGPDGYPHPMPMWFALDDDGTVRMTTFRKSQKVRNVQRNPKVSLLAEDGDDYFELRGVVVYGCCEVVDDIDVVTQTLMRTSATDVGDDPKAQEGMKAVVGATAAKRVCLVIRPERVVSWDHRKLGGTY